MEATTTSTTTAATGNIQIIEADSQGKFVRLFNSGTKVSRNYYHTVEKLTIWLEQIPFTTEHWVVPKKIGTPPTEEISAVRRGGVGIV